MVVYSMEFMPKNLNKDDIMLVDMIYSYGNKDNDYTDTLDIIYKDLRTGEKKLRTIEKPPIEVFFVKNEYRNYSHNKNYIEIDKTEKHICPIRNVPWYIARVAGREYEQALKESVMAGDKKALRRMQLYPYVFGSDMGCEEFYRVQWLLEYDNDKPKPISKAYYDIEVDGIDIPGFPEMGECPVNIITLVNDENKSVYTFILNEPRNPQIKDFVEHLDEFIDELHEMFDEAYGVLDYSIYMYDDERELIKSFFKAIHTLKPDFAMAWNGHGFDNPYLIERIIALGMDPKEVMCHPDFKNKVCRFVKDNKNFEIKNKTDSLVVSGYTKFIDDERLYAATRKGQLELRSVNLNAIGESELGDVKIDYSEEANIKTLPYKNFKKFVAYNIKDVLLQSGIEHKVNDLDGLYLRSYLNCTPYDKVFQQTAMLKCRAYYEYILQGNILGNNVNVGSTEKGGFEGAIVGNPLLNDYEGVEIFGHKSMYVFANVIDMDFSAMYPHIIVSHNIERNTMIGKLIIPGFEIDPYDHFFVDEEIYDNSDDEDDDEDELTEEPEVLRKYDAGRDFVEGYLTGDILSFGKRWFNLPSYDELVKDFKEEYKVKPRKHFSIRKVLKKFNEIIKIK